MTMVLISSSLWRIFKGVFTSHLLIVRFIIPLVVCQKAADAGTGRGTGYVLRGRLASLIWKGNNDRIFIYLFHFINRGN